MTRLFARLVTLAAILAAVQALYASATGYRQRPNQPNVWRQHFHQHCDVFLLGDSTFFPHPLGDNTCTPLPGCVRPLLGGLQVAALSDGGFRVPDYARFVSVLAEENALPRLLVVCLNLRLFSPYWACNPHSSYERELLFLENDNPLFWTFYKPLATFGAFNLTPVSVDDYRRMPVYFGDQQIGTIGDFDFLSAGDHPSQGMVDDWLVTCYMGPIRSGHPHLALINDIVDSCRSAGGDVLFYATPINHDMVEQRLGFRAREQLAANIQTIRTATEAASARFVDLSTILPGRCFNPEERYPNEHMTQEGREILAQHLAKAIRETDIFERSGCIPDKNLRMIGGQRTEETVAWMPKVPAR